MNLKRTSIIFVCGAALAAWLSAAIAPARPPAPVDTTAPMPVDASGAALANEIARLRERLRPDHPPSQPTRNPFAFEAPPSAAATVIAPPPAADPAFGAAPINVPRFRLTLAGIAEDPSPDGGGPLRTAIITGNGQLFLAKSGDIVNDQDAEYKVGAIAADSAELTDLRDNTTRRLTLK